MATFTVVETFEGRDGEKTADSGRSFTRVFYVSTSDPNVTSADIEAAAGVPGLGEPFLVGAGGGIVGASVTSVHSSQRESPYEWKVEVRYSAEKRRARDGALGAGGEPGGGPGGATVQPEGGGNGGGGNNGGGGGGGGPAESQIENPLFRPAKVSWGTSKVQVVAEKDVTGKYISNSAYLEFDPPVMREEVRLVLKIQRNELLFNANTIVRFSGTINHAAWFGFAAETVRLTGLSAEREYENGLYFWSVSYEFEILNPDELNTQGGAKTWQLEVLDSSWYELNDGGDGWDVILEDRLGVATSHPFLLNGAGHKRESDFADPTFLTFDVYKVQNFRLLGLGG